jgi:hypothetical protein
MEYEAVIGLETHVQLKTKSKMWCGCANAFGAPANTNVCPVCLGMPGVLPVANAEALRLTVLTGFLLNCEIPRFAKFDRKNYFYPDSAKNYQVTQYDKPSTREGFLDFEFNGGISRVRITRAHLEEDAGKNLHDESGKGGDTLVDLNRTGTPLLAAEVSQKPVPRNAAQPRTKIAATTEAAQVAPRCDEHLLRQIIRLRDIVELPGKITSQHQFIPPHHLQIQIRLTAFNAVEECGETGFVGVHASCVLAFFPCVPEQFPISQKIALRILPKTEPPPQRRSWW